MRTAKAMSAAALALTIIAAPVTAHAAPAPVTIMPGDTINTNYVVATGTCTAAAPARDANGNRYLLTAGHCVNGKLGELVGQPIYFKRTLIGHVARAQFQIVDYAVIKLLPNVVIGQNDVPHVAYLGQLNPGSKVCFHGTKSGVRCGKISQLNELSFMRGAIVPGFVRGSSATLRSIPGDSGSAVYNTEGVIGILSGGADGVSMYVPIKSVYDRAGAAIPGFHLGN